MRRDFSEKDCSMSFVVVNNLENKNIADFFEKWKNQKGIITFGNNDFMKIETKDMANENKEISYAVSDKKGHVLFFEGINISDSACNEDVINMLSSLTFL